MEPNNFKNIGILSKDFLSLSDIKDLLSTTEELGQKLIRNHAYQIKSEVLGKVVHYRGLLEISNKCEKDCYYCGIRATNSTINRYELSKDEIIAAAQFALEAGYGSIVIQSGEKSNQKFIKYIEESLIAIKNISDNKLSITLSCGEQTDETYLRWRAAGADRYLLRIETTNINLYHQIHPHNNKHSFDLRMKALYSLKKFGYQLGTGIMIGLPNQTIADLAKDLEFFREFDIDMVGMGPYIEHSQTPLYQHKNLLMTLDQRYQLSLLMIATLRIIMKDINIAAATALQAIKWNGREEAILSGANIIMPNITPKNYRSQYLLYENKPCTDEQPNMCKNCLEARITKLGEKVGYFESGDSLHILKNKNFL
jgi:biotin synthase